MQRLVGGADAPWSEHIAAADPPFMLAVADWLDDEADAHSGEIFDRWDGADDCCRMPAALNVARAYLRSES